METRSKRFLITSLFFIIALLFLSLGSVQARFSPQEWKADVSLPQALADARMVHYQDFMFVIGGKTANGPTDDVYVKAIFSGEWRSESSLPTPLYAHAVALLSSTLNDAYVYVIGGWDGSQVRKEIWRAKVFGDGHLDSWQWTSNYPFPVYFHDAVVIEGRLYVIGGTQWGIGDRTDQIYSAPIHADGSLGAWREERPMPQKLFRLAATSHYRTLYISGGSTGGTIPSDMIYFTQVETDGRLAPWRAQRMLIPREHHAMIVRPTSPFGGSASLYLLGGRGPGKKPLISVETYPLAFDGVLQSPQDADPLPRPLYRFGATEFTYFGTVPVFDVSYILIGGGLSANNYDFRDDVYQSEPQPLVPSPTFTPTPTNTPTPLPTPTYTPTPEAPRIALDLTAYQPTEGYLTYTISFSNPTDVLAESVVITNSVPMNAWVTNITHGGEIRQGEIIWHIGDVPGSKLGLVSYTIGLPRPTPTFTPTPTATPSTPGMLGGQVWRDDNGDGIRDEGIGVAGVNVQLYTSSDCTSAPILARETNTGGYYLFSNLSPGTYSIHVDKPEGWLYSPTGHDSKVDPTTGCTDEITLHAGQNDRSWYAGIYQPNQMSIFNDTLIPSSDSLDIHGVAPLLTPTMTPTPTSTPSSSIIVNQGAWARWTWRGQTYASSTLPLIWPETRRVWLPTIRRTDF